MKVPRNSPQHPLAGTAPAQLNTPQQVMERRDANVKAIKGLRVLSPKRAEQLAEAFDKIQLQNITLSERLNVMIQQSFQMSQYLQVMTDLTAVCENITTNGHLGAQDFISIQRMTRRLPPLETVRMLLRLHRAALDAFEVGQPNGMAVPESAPIQPESNQPGNGES
jgi:hypothetical protein